MVYENKDVKIDLFNKISDTKEKIGKLTEIFLNKTLIEDVYKEKINKYNNLLNSYQNQLFSISKEVKYQFTEKQIRDYLINSIQNVNNNSLENKKVLVDTYIDQLLIYNDNRVVVSIQCKLTSDLVVNLALITYFNTITHP